MADSATNDRIETIRGVHTLEALYEQAGKTNVTPGWLRRDETSPAGKQQSEYVPAHWGYDVCKAALDAAGRLIDVSLADRRNLIMCNPLGGNGVMTTRTLVAAYQMILPGEKAPSHRHTAHALRVIIDAHGAYSTVDGEKTPMETGDVVLTPGWCWHEHGHDGDEPAYWFDGLDVPFVRTLENMFFEDNPVPFDPKPRPVATLPLSARRDRAPSRRGGRRQRRFPRTARHARGADDAYHAADDGAAGRGGPHALPALDCQPHLLLRRGERRDCCGRQALGMATRRYLRGAVLDQVRAHRRSRRTAVFDVRRATDALLPLLPVRSGLISRSISTASLTFAKMTAVRARR
jgi:Cupin domain